MYYWKTGLLAKELNENKLNQKEIFKYFIGGSIINIMQTYYASATKIEKFDSLLILSIFLALSMTIIGSIIIFNINERGDGKAFLERFLCLSFPISIKIALARVGLYIGYILAYAILTSYGIIKQYESLMYGAYYVGSFLFLVIFFMILAKHIKVASINNIISA